MQTVFNEYQAVTDMCSYFSKFENEYSLAMRQAANEAFEKNMINYKTMQEIVPAYFSKRNSLVQDVVYHVLTELHLRKTFPDVCFFNSNVPKERT